MDIGYGHGFVLLVVGLFIGREFLLIHSADYTNRLKIMGYASYALVGAFISTIIFTGGELIYMGLLWIVCAPTWGYSCYLFYKQDKQKVIRSYIVVTLCIVTTFLFTYMQ